MDQILQVTAGGDAGQRLQTMWSMMINIAAERFFLKEQRYCGTKLSGEEDPTVAAGIRNQFKQAKEEDKAALAELQNIVRS